MNNTFERVREKFSWAGEGISLQYWPDAIFVSPVSGSIAKISYGRSPVFLRC